MKILLGICFLFASIHASEGIKFEDLDKISKVIVKDLTDNNGMFELTEQTQKHWYLGKAPLEFTTSLSDQMTQKAIVIKRIFGEPREKIAIAGSKRIGRLLGIIYYREYTGIDFPVRIDYVQRDGLYYLCGIRFGEPIIEDWAKICEGVQGKIAEEPKTDETKKPEPVKPKGTFP